MILIFDGNNTFFRNYAASPVADQNGNPAGGIIGSIRSIKWILRETKATRIYWIWDAPGGSRKRRNMIEGYKAGRRPHLNRQADESPGDEQNNLIWQLKTTEQILDYLGVTQIAVQDIEADDTIAYLCDALEGHRKCVVSADRDMWQLVDDTTTVYWPTKKVYITNENFSEQTPFLPENYVLARAMSGKGDTSDNIHGIKGLGDKTIEKIFPILTTTPITLDELLVLIRDDVAEWDKEDKDLRRKMKELGYSESKIRWYRTLLENQELVRKNIEVMQLTSPVISANSASIIRNAMDAEPKFNITKFKLALITSGIQLTDSDLFVTFQEYRVRTNHANS